MENFWEYIQFWLAESIVGVFMLLMFALVGSMLVGGYVCYKKMIGEE